MAKPNWLGRNEMESMQEKFPGPRDSTCPDPSGVALFQSTPKVKIKPS
jgi:hypothetical protein